MKKKKFQQLSEYFNWETLSDIGKPISLFILKNKGEKSNIKDIMGFYGLLDVKSNI